MALNEGCILRISKIEPRPIARISRRDQVQRVVQEGEAQRICQFLKS